MSNNLLEKKEQSFNKNKPENEEKKSDDNLMDPVRLLSSDLLKEINNIEDKHIEKKKETSTENIQLDDTQKESDENEEGEEEEDILSDLDKDIFNFQIFQNDNKEKVNEQENNFLEKDDKPKIKTKVQSSLYLNNINPINNDSSLYINETRSFSYDYNVEQNKNYNNMFNSSMNDLNDMQNQLQFFNNSFTMNGRPGWVCTNCKNFNYEIRIKCNRCGKGNNNLSNLFQQQQQNNSFNSPINNSRDGLNDILLYNKMKEINLRKEKNAKKNGKKHFTERPGDWICYNCQNLNFTFRTSCNRCNLPKFENQKLFQKLKMNTMNFNYL